MKEMTYKSGKKAQITSKKPFHGCGLVENSHKYCKEGLALVWCRRKMAW